MNVPQSANRYGFVTITTAIAISPANTRPLTASLKRSAGASNAAATSAITTAPSEYLKRRREAHGRAAREQRLACARSAARSRCAHSASAHGSIPGPSLSASRE